LTVPFTYILEWHILAHASICIPFLLFSCTHAFWRKLVACTDYYYQLPDDIIVIAVIPTPPFAERRALFDVVRRWRRVLCCYFCDGCCCCCAEWERGYGYGYPLCCVDHAVIAILARKPLCASRRWWW
jgi:hypothetical protein